MPLMLGWFVPPRVTTCLLANPKVSRAAEGGVVWGREAACSAVLANLWQASLGDRLWHEHRRHRSPQPSTTSYWRLRCIVVLRRFGSSVERDEGGHPLCGAEFGASSVLSGGRVGVAEACPEWFRSACGSGVWKPLREAALQPMPVGAGSTVADVTVRPDDLVRVCSTPGRANASHRPHAERRTAVALPVWAAGLGVPGQRGWLPAGPAGKATGEASRLRRNARCP